MTKDKVCPICYTPLVDSQQQCSAYKKLRNDVDELLSIIHGDDGEYTLEHGHEKSCDDAGSIILKLYGKSNDHTTN